MATFDRWALLKLIEIFMVLACLICKRVTDDEARSLTLYLQKISREWSLLRNVTWDRVGAAVAHVAFGGYFIITVALFIGRCVGELPTEKRITERILLVVGAILFIVLSSLSFAALDSLPHDLIDNAAVFGCLTFFTGILFLVDVFGPGKRVKKGENGASRTYQNFSNISKSPRGSDQNLEEGPQTAKENVEKHTTNIEISHNGVQHNNNNRSNGQQNDNKPHLVTIKEISTNISPKAKAIKSEIEQRFYGNLEDDFGKRFGIYGKDALDETDRGETEQYPERHSPVWSQSRKAESTYRTAWKYQDSKSGAPSEGPK